MKILFVLGYAASGKSTYVESIRRADDDVVEIGDIVRSLSGKEKRVFKSSLDKDIINVLKHRILNSSAERVIISSPRNERILKAVRGLVGRENVYVDILDVPYAVRKTRFYARHAAKDDGTRYEDVLAGDRSIGLDELIAKETKASKQDPNIRVVQW